MRPEAPLEAWTWVGESPTMDFYVDPAQPRILVLWPKDFASETGATAVLNRGFIQHWFRERPGGVLVFLDRLVELDRAGREAHTRVYGETLVGAAYVGGTPLSRALMAFMMGLKPLLVPIRMVGSYPEGVRWLANLLDGEEAA